MAAVVLAVQNASSHDEKRKKEQYASRNAVAPFTEDMNYNFFSSEPPSVATSVGALVTT